MFGLSWSEILVVAGLSVMLLRPEDLPVIMRGLKEARKKIGELRGEFVQRISDISRELELSEIRNQVRSFEQSVDPRRIMDCLQPQTEYRSGAEQKKVIVAMSTHNTTNVMADHAERVNAVLPPDHVPPHEQK
ncbi:twin-arginine translocase TatA/TatE family subunit [Komagataeibacter diospyri]|uniref:Sec-independent protein translocase subunit TatA/TatB n=1 Tax=Komagataeibacter diospyri TaxID=1932662 RepID=UPI003757FFC6